MTAGDSIRRQVQAAKYEAGFSLACTLAVCVHEEWGDWAQVGAAVAIPVAMAFCVHGLNNYRGLPAVWMTPYLVTRVVVVVLGIAYSYQHYYHFLHPLPVFGLDLRPFVAVTMELLTISALIAHEAHTTRLTEPAAESSATEVEERFDQQPATPEPPPADPPVPVLTGSGDPLPLAARLRRA